MSRRRSRRTRVPEPLLEIHGLRKDFVLRRSALPALRRRPPEVLRAVDGVDLDVAHGEALGLVGESGSGKSTLGRCVVGLSTPTAGEIRYAGRRLAPRRTRSERR